MNCNGGEICSNTTVTYEEIRAADPTNYDLLYELMHNRCCDIAQHYGKSVDFTVATSSGTPQMQTCWLLLVLGGVFNARLVQLALRKARWECACLVFE